MPFFCALVVDSLICMSWSLSVLTAQIFSAVFIHHNFSLPIFVSVNDPSFYRLTYVIV